MPGLDTNLCTRTLENCPLPKTTTKWGSNNDFNELYDKRNDFFIKDNSAVRNTVFALGAIGLAALVYGFITDPVRTWGAVLMNNVLFFFPITCKYFKWHKDTVELLGFVQSKDS